MGNEIFISHATADDAVVKELREALEARGVAVWADSRELAPGDNLEPEIQKAIEEARHFLVVLGPQTQNSRWVRKEIKHALKVRKKRGDAYRVIPLLLPGVEPSALELWFGKEPVAARVSPKPGGVEQTLPDLLAALDLTLPEDGQPPVTKDSTPVADLILELSEPTIATSDGKRRATAKAVLIYDPPEPNAGEVASRAFRFTAPLGAIEAGELAWYLEGYPRWPAKEGVFADRAKAVVEALPKWGKQLYEDAIAPALASDAGRNAFSGWNDTPHGTERRFSVLVDEDFLADPTLDDEAKAAQEAEAKEAATLLLSLPWELVHDDTDYLFQGARGVRVRRRLPNQISKDPITTVAPLRVLLVSPRPEDKHAKYIDHRVSARPLVESLATLGDLARLTILNPPTFGALQAELERARAAGEPYHVVHFDGHGVFDHPDRDGLGGHHGLGALVFEHSDDAGKLERRRSDLVNAKQIAGIIRDHRVPLFFLDACQSAQAEKDPTSSVAGKLLQGGVASVAAMSHSVLVETARRFIRVFYEKLLSGERVGQAMLAAQQALKADPYRRKAFTGELRLEDWFVPVLFQEETDPQLIRETPSERVREEIDKARKLALGRLPEPPAHSFVGRSRELLQAERLLCRDGKGATRHIVLRGEGGEGKTVLGCELARWLVASQRFERAAFVSLEQSGDARTTLWAIGEQLVPDFLSRAGQEPAKAEQYVERALRDHSTLIVLDNCESVLPPVGWQAEAGEAAGTFDPEVLNGLLALCGSLSVVGATRLVFTTRTPLPKPFNDHHLTIDRLDKAEAIALVGKVLGEGNRLPRAARDVENEQQIEALVEAVNCHARSLVLVARELMDRNLPQTTATLHQIMADLHARYPNDRERSLFASVELSLRRLPAELRAKLPPLAVFQGGGMLWPIDMVLGLGGPEQVKQLAAALVEVGLAEVLPYGYLRLDPALGPALERELSESERQVAEAAWADAMAQLTSLLHQQRFKDAQLAATLALLELPNLLAALEYRARRGKSEVRNPKSEFSWDSVVDMATSLESLLQNLGRPKALARAVALREQIAQHLGDWSAARFESKRSALERLLDTGQLSTAVKAAKALLDEAMKARENAYPGAPYDIAGAHFMYGRALSRSGDPQSALIPLAEAETRFQKLADAGNKDAARMAAVSLTERADCLTALGQLDEAATAYEEAIERGKKRDDKRSVATNKGQLGTVRMFQGRHADALAAYTEARETFERLGEPAGVAAAWHQIGMVYQEGAQYEAAERAYQESLRITVQRGDRLGECNTLTQLGNLYSQIGRREDAVRFFRQAANIDLELGDLRGEGIDRNNIADELVKLGRHDEARREILRAIECSKPFGHAALPWTSYAILSNIERAVSDAPAAAQAREQAIAAYLAYRRNGGEPIGRGICAQLCAAAEQAIRAGHTAQAAAELTELQKKPDLPAYTKPVLPVLQSILTGSRDRALAADPNLDYDDAAELHLLLDRLGVPQ